MWVNTMRTAQNIKCSIKYLEDTQRNVRMQHRVIISSDQSDKNSEISKGNAEIFCMEM